MWNDIWNILKDHSNLQEHLVFVSPHWRDEDITVMCFGDRDLQEIVSSHFRKKKIVRREGAFQNRVIIAAYMVIFSS